MAKLDLITAELRRRLRTSDLRLGDIIPTQKQFASELGVAVGTIRQAMIYLQDEGLVVSTRGRGTVLARPLKSSLPRNGAKKLGLLVPGQLTALAPVTTASVQALHHECQRLGHWEPRLRSSLEPLDRRHLQKWAEELHAIAVLGAATPALAQAIHALGKPVLFSGELLEGPCPSWASQLSVDFDSTMAISLQFLMSMGHTRITLVRPGKSWSSQAMGAAFALTAESHGLKDCFQQVIMEESSDERKFIKAIEDGNHRSTGLIVEGGLRAGRLLHLCLQSKLRVPEDLSVLALNSVAPELLVTTDLSRLEFDANERAGRIIRIAEEMLENHVIVRERTTPRLIWGKTCLRLEKETHLS